MNQKVGKTVWKIHRNHHEFSQHDYKIFTNIKKNRKDKSSGNNLMNMSES